MSKKEIIQQLKTKFHENYIGSEQCGECVPKGSGKFSLSKDGNEIICQNCKGKGYTIPLEFGCEVEVSGGVFEKNKVVKIGFGFGWVAEHNQIFSIEGKHYYQPIENNLGKPLTLQDVLRLVQEKKKENGGGRYKVELDLYILMIFDVEKSVDDTVYINLLKPIEEQDTETLQALLELLDKE